MTVGPVEAVEPVKVPRNLAPLPETCPPEPWFGLVKMRYPGGWNYGTGAVIAAPRQDVVCTAAHVVYDKDKDPELERCEFIPAYSNGQAPLGSYRIAQIYTLPAYRAYQASGPDIAFLKLEQPVMLPPGTAKPIAFDNYWTSQQWFGGVTQFGYPFPEVITSPSAPNVLPHRQAAPIADREDPDMMPTEKEGGRAVMNVSVVTGFTEGGSGGPVLSGYDPAAGGGGTIIGVMASATLPHTVFFNNLAIYGRVAEELYLMAVQGMPPLPDWQEYVPSGS